ncbi:MAG: PhaM family polyhydroxyalkanoate granule multifunctional regulatory protein [Georgfuchsia sp.]
MTDSTTTDDSMEFLRKMWGNMGIPVPGMVVPTLDVGELEKRIADLKAVEGWLKMNLNMLQLHIQGLEMQCSTLHVMKNLGPGGDPAAANNPFSNPASWPWNVMQQMAAAATSTTAEQKPEGEEKKG